MDPKLYELFCVAVSQSEEEVETLLGRIRAKIEAKSGMLQDTPRLAKRRLSYPIRKQQEAYVFPLTFFIKPEYLPELKEALEREPELLRYLLVRHERVSRPAREPRPARARPAEKKALELAEIDRKLDEIIGKT